jgi:lipoprotein-anchoring transpeptidase ErfK/SrfK
VLDLTDVPKRHGDVVSARSSLFAVALVPALLLAAGCGGGAAPVSSAPPPPPPTSTAAAPGQQLRTYLANVRAATLVLRVPVREAAVALRASTSATAPARPRLALARAAAAYRGYAAMLRVEPVPAALAAGHRELIRSARQVTRALERSGRAVSRGGTPGRTARRLLDRAARHALAWEGIADAAAQAQSVSGAGSTAVPARLAQVLLHAAQAAAASVVPPGVHGPQVVALQRRLATLTYLPAGYSTGTVDYRTEQAVIAFQGWEGLARDGVAGPRTLARLRVASAPRAWSTTTRHIELHMAQQVLLLVGDGRVRRSIHVSTAAPGHVTPTGTFTIYRKERMSWSVPFQVWMPYASYFTGGYALHEYPDVPPYPASHGCVRVPAGDSVVVWDFAALGTPIVIG